MNVAPLAIDSIAMFPDHWSAALQALAGQLAFRELTASETIWLIAQEPTVRPALGMARRPDIPASLAADAPDLLARIGLPAFARISPCSFKDGFAPCAPIRSVGGLLRQLEHPGPRAASLALRAHLAGSPISLIIRPWLHIRSSTEIRIFIRDRKVEGASQLHAGARVPKQHAPIASRVAAIGEAIAARAPAASLIADVWLHDSGAEPVLIETNPYSARTDPVLYDWRADLPTDRHLRLVDAEGSMYALPLA